MPEQPEPQNGLPPAGHALPLPATADEIAAWVQHLRETRDHIRTTLSPEEVEALGRYTFVLVHEISRLREDDARLQRDLAHAMTHHKYEHHGCKHEVPHA